MKSDKSMPFLNIILKLPICRRGQYLKICQTFVIDDLNDLLSNLKLKKLTKSDKTIVSKIVYSKSLRKKRQIILSQNGSFFSRILPYILSKFNYFHKILLTKS